LTTIFPTGYDFKGQESSVIIAPIPPNVSTLIEDNIFTFVHFENMFYGCIGDNIHKESE